MKKIVTCGLVILVTSGISIVVNEYLNSDPHYPDNVILARLHSEVLKEEREVIIHLPPNYDSTAKYPVMYVLDGSSEDNHIANKFDILSVTGHVPKVIVIGIPNMTAENRQRNLVPPFMRIDAEKEDSPFGGGDQFLSFMEKELFPFVESKYPVSRTRLFSGYSRGGLLVMYSLLHKPDLFQARFCYSAPFWRQDDILISKASDFLNAKDSLNGFLYMSAGANETDNIKGGLERLVKVFEEKSPAGFVWYSEYTPDADHQDNSRKSAALGIGKWGEYLKTLIP